MRPLLAYTIEDVSEIRYPVLVSTKFDGIRCIIHNGEPKSRTLKPIPNKFVRSQLSEFAKKFPNWTFDGELMAGDSFYTTASGITSHEGEPEFKFAIFDSLVDLRTDEPFRSRIERLYEIWEELPSFCFVVPQVLVNDQESLLRFYQQQLDEGNEGVIVRNPEGIYKFGRSTKKEGIIGKLKPFKDAEFQIIGCECWYTNNNPSELNELGYKKKSSSKENLVAVEMLGSFLCNSPAGVFGVASGLTMEQRVEFWKHRDSLMGKWIKVKYLDFGIKQLPRHPVFLGFRDPELD